MCNILLFQQSIEGKQQAAIDVVHAVTQLESALIQQEKHMGAAIGYAAMLL